jgi:hypothetical protein
MMQEKMADEISGHCSTGSSSQKNRLIAAFELLKDFLDEGTFASTLSTFKRDEH